VLTQHDRSDISNWVRGRRTGRVSDIEVLARIADGLQITDEGRMRLGLAPSERDLGDVSGAYRPGLLSSDHSRGTSSSAEGAALPVRIAICGSRAPGTHDEIINAAIQALARFVMAGGYVVSHGPVGIGIEVMTFVADHYAPADFARAIGLFGHRNVVQNAEVIVVIGGGPGTQIEIDLALSMNKRVVALPSSGGTACSFFERARSDPRLRSWMSDEMFAALDSCLVEHQDAHAVDEFARIIEHLLIHDPGAADV